MFSSNAFSAPQSQPAAEAAAKKPRQEDRQTCLPITIRAIDCAVAQRGDTGGELSFHGAEAGMLLLVGLVETLTRQAASIELSLNDATGRIKARHYMSDRQANDLDALAPGRYVSVFGSVRTAPEVHFAVAGMSLVQSADEVSYHMIEAAYAALKLQKGQADPVSPAPKKKAIMEAEVTPQKLESLAPVAVTAAADAPKERLSSAGLKKAVLRFLQKEGEGKPEGVSVAAVCSHISSTPADDVTAALQKLIDAGEIFTTIDDDHFLCL